MTSWARVGKRLARNIDVANEFERRFEELRTEQELIPVTVEMKALVAAAHTATMVGQHLEEQVERYQAPLVDAGGRAVAPVSEPTLRAHRSAVDDLFDELMGEVRREAEERGTMVQTVYRDLQERERAKGTQVTPALAGGRDGTIVAAPIVGGAGVAVAAPAVGGTQTVRPVADKQAKRVRHAAVEA